MQEIVRNRIRVPLLERRDLFAGDAENIRDGYAQTRFGKVACPVIVISARLFLFDVA